MYRDIYKHLPFSTRVYVPLKRYMHQANIALVSAN